MQLQQHLVSNKPAAGPSRSWRLVVWVLIIVCAIYFLWRGPIRAATASGDLTVGYSAARAWIAGDDPYDPVILRGHLERAGGVDEATEARMNFMRNIYLPVTIPVFIPVATLPWSVARITW